MNPAAAVACLQSAPLAAFRLKQNRDPCGLRRAYPASLPHCCLAQDALLHWFLSKTQQKRISAQDHLTHYNQIT
jgi:hypothetical protein